MSACATPPPGVRSHDRVSDCMGLAPVSTPSTGFTVNVPAPTIPPKVTGAKPATVPTGNMYGPAELMHRISLPLTKLVVLPPVTADVEQLVTVSELVPMSTMRPWPRLKVPTDTLTPL